MEDMFLFLMQLAKVKADDSTPRISTVRADDVSPRSRSIVDAETKGLTEKLRMSEQRNTEYRNQVQSLKNEIKIAHKVCVLECSLTLTGVIKTSLGNGQEGDFLCMRSVSG